MPSYRDPLGVVIQPIPSWNLNNCASITVIGNETAGAITECGLANNDPLGRSLVVWSLGISHDIENTGDPFDLTAGAQLYGTLGFQPYLTPQNLNPTVGQLPGGGWFDGTSPGFVNNSYMAPLLRGAVAYEWPHDWPVCVIYPGYSLSVIFVNNSGSAVGQCAANFFYEVARYT